MDRKKFSRPAGCYGPPPLLFGYFATHAASFAISTFTIGSDGGFNNAGDEKSNISNIGSEFASRAVNAGKLKRASTKRTIEVWLCTTCETKCGRA